MTAGLVGMPFVVVGVGPASVTILVGLADLPMQIFTESKR